MCEDNIKIGEYVWKLKQKPVEWLECRPWAVRPAAAASVSGSSCRLVCFRHRWSSVCAVTKTGPELLSAWISGCTCGGKVLPPRWISSSSCLLQPLPGIPRAKPSTFLPPSALSSSSSWTSISSPLSHSLRLHEQPLLILMSLNVTSSLTVSVLLAGSPQICVCGVLSKTTVLSLRKHLEQTESGLTPSWCFWWIRLCRLARGPVWSEKCCWFESHQGWSEARLRCRWNIAKVCHQRRCVLVEWAKSEGRPHMQMLLCVVCCWFPLCWAVNSLKRLRYESGDRWSGLCLLHDGRINAEEEEKSVWCLNGPQRLTNNQLSGNGLDMDSGQIPLQISVGNHITSAKSQQNPDFSGPSFVDWKEAAKAKEKLIRLIKSHGNYTNWITKTESY